MIAPKHAMRPIHPGAILREECLLPWGLTAHALALALHVAAPRFSEIARENRAVTADTAMRLGRFFGMTPDSWRGLQSDYEIVLTRQSLSQALKSIRPYKAPVAA